MAYEDDGAYITSYAIFIVVLFVVFSHNFIRTRQDFPEEV